MTEANLQYFREYRVRNRRKLRAYNREYNKRWRKLHGYHNEKKWDEANLLKVRVQDRLSWAVRSGKLRRKPCEVCGRQKTLGHHEDYSKALEVKWLCAFHHKQVHLGIMGLTRFEQ